MLRGWPRLNGPPRLDYTRFQSRVLLQVEHLDLPAIRLILVDRSEIGFLSHCLPSPFSVTEANGSQVEFVPRAPKKKSLTSPRRMHPNVRLVTTVTQFLSAVLVSRRIANLDRSNTHSGSSEFDYGAIPHVEHLGKIRFRTISGLCLPRRFICSTLRLAGNAKHRYWRAADNPSRPPRC